MAQTLIQSPALIASFNTPMWYVVSESALTTNYMYKFRVDLINPDNWASMITLGVYSIPPNGDGLGVFSPHQVVKQGYEVSKIFSGFDGVSAAKKQILLYNTRVGYETDVNSSFIGISNVTYAGNSVVRLNFFPIGGSPTSGYNIGDEITIDKTQKQYNPQYDGRCKILDISTYNITVNLPYGVAVPGGIESGKITKLLRFAPQDITQMRWACNAIVQYGETNQLNHATNGSRVLEDYDGYKTIQLQQDEVVTFKSAVTPVNAPYTITWKLFNAANVQVDTFTVPALPSTQLPPNVPGSINLSYNLQVGTKTLEAHTNPVTFPNVVYYTVTVPNVDPVQRKIDRECYSDNTRFVFINSLGGWAFWNFTTKKKVATTTITRNEYSSALPYNYNIGDREIGSIDLKTTTEFEISSDWLNEYDYSYLKQLLVSPDVYILDESTGYKYPIIITDTQYTTKTYKIDKVFNLVVKYKMAYADNNQNN